MGLHKYKSIIDLFEKYLYQDLEALYEMDVGEYKNTKEAKVALQQLQELRVQGMM